MSDITSFLFQGDPIPPQPTGSDTSTSYPLWLQQYTYNLANAATNLAQTEYQPFAGPKVAGPSDQTQTAWQMAGQNAGAWQPFVNSASELTQSAGTPVSSDDIGRFMNPYQDQVVGALQQASNRNLTNNILPSIQDRFVSAGQSRSPQEMYASNEAIFNSDQSLNQAVAGALSQGYNTSLDAALRQKTQQQTAGAQMGTLGGLTSNLGAVDTGQMAAAGSAQDQLNQANLNAAVNDWNTQQQWPYLNLGFASNIIRGQAVPQTTQTVSQQFNPYQSNAPSPLSAFVSGAGQAKSLGFRKGGAVGALSRQRFGFGGSAMSGMLSQIMASGALSQGQEQPGASTNSTSGSSDSTVGAASTGDTGGGSGGSGGSYTTGGQDGAAPAMSSTSSVPDTSISPMTMNVVKGFAGFMDQLRTQAKQGQDQASNGNPGYAQGGVLTRYAEGGSVEGRFKDAPVPERKPWDLRSKARAPFVYPNGDKRKLTEDRGLDALAANARRRPFDANRPGVDQAMDDYYAQDPSAFNDDAGSIMREKARGELDQHFARGGALSRYRRAA